VYTEEYQWQSGKGTHKTQTTGLSFIELAASILQIETMGKKERITLNYILQRECRIH
jgi:hypothetical protein